MEKLTTFMSGLCIGSSLIMFLVVFSTKGTGDVFVPVIFLLTGIFLSVVGFYKK